MIGRRAAHDRERDAALYVSGEMHPRARRRYEAHLLRCEECWTEVSLGRRGRLLAEASRELAPPGLRDDVRASIAVLTPARRTRPWRVVMAASLVLILSAAAVEVVRSNREPAAIASAISMYEGKGFGFQGPPLHGDQIVEGEGLRIVASGRVDLAGLQTDLFSLRDAAGERAFLFVSDTPFPVARGATSHGPSGRGWQVSTDGLMLVCGDRPMNYLVIARNPSLVGPVEQAVAGPLPAA